jgi:hypothetical protein
MFIVKLFDFDVQVICALLVLSDLKKGWGVKIRIDMCFVVGHKFHGFVQHEQV